MPRPIRHRRLLLRGAALCYRTICLEAAAMLGPHAHPTIVLHHLSQSRYNECLDRGTSAAPTDLLLESAEKLAGAGAEFLICPDNTMHTAFAEMIGRSPLPWLHIADVVADEAKARGFGTVGILGTRWLAGSNVYPERLEARGRAGGGRTKPTSTKSIASSWMSWSTGTSIRGRSPTFRSSSSA